MNKEDSEIHNKIFSYVGAASTYFNQVESSLLNTVNFFINKSDRQIGKIITKNMSFSNVLDLFKKLGENFFKKKNASLSDLDNLKEIYINLKNLNEKRNDLIHSSWFKAVGKDGVFIKSGVRQKKGKPLSERFTNPDEIIENLQNYIRDLDNAYDVLEDFQINNTIKKSGSGFYF